MHQLAAFILLLGLSVHHIQAQDSAASKPSEVQDISQPGSLNSEPSEEPQNEPAGPIGSIGTIGSNSSSVSAAKCGTVENDFAPCVAKERADSLFKHCCQQYAPEGCQSLCHYDTDEQTARAALLQAVKSGKCELKHMSTVLYCASQNQVSLLDM